MTLPEPLTIDVDAAIARAPGRWNTRTSGTESEGAFIDRTLLAREVLRLRQELADTIDALAESDTEIERLEQTIDLLTKEPNLLDD